MRRIGTVYFLSVEKMWFCWAKLQAPLSIISNSWVLISLSLNVRTSTKKMMFHYGRWITTYWNRIINGTSLPRKSMMISKLEYYSIRRAFAGKGEKETGIDLYYS